MNRNVKIAKQLLKLARILIGNEDNVEYCLSIQKKGQKSGEFETIYDTDLEKLRKEGKSNSQTPGTKCVLFKVGNPKEDRSKYENWDFQIMYSYENGNEKFVNEPPRRRPNPSDFDDFWSTINTYSGAGRYDGDYDDYDNPSSDRYE